MSASGAIVANIDPLNGTPLRSRDGSTVAVVSSSGDGRVSVSVYDASTGTPLQQLSAGAPLDVASEELISFDIAPAISADGAWLGLIGHVMRYRPGTVRSVTKGGAYGVDEYIVPVGERASSLTLEVINLTAGVSLGLKELESFASSIGFAQPIFADDSDRLLVNYLVEGQAVLRRFGVDGGSLTEERSSFISRDTLPYGLPSIVTSPLSTRFLSNPATVVSFIDAEQVVVIDARSLGITRRVPVSPESWRRGKPSLIVSADGAEGYAVLPSGVAVQFVDLVAATASTLRVEPVEGATPAPFPLVPFSAVSYQAEHGRLLLSHGAAQGGVSVIDISEQTVSGNWMSGEPVAGVWSSADEELVAAIDASGALHLLDAQGAEVSVVPIGSAVLRIL